MYTEICICIPTHRRPRQLQRLLTSLVEQEQAPPFEVIVVDNDAECSAKPVADEFLDRLSLTYLVEPIRGLARVRNRAVAASNRKYLAFIDDDHCASPRWLASLYQTAIQTHAAAVVGRITVLFDKKIPDFIRACRYFSKVPYSDGEIVPWYDATVTNSIIRRDALPHPSAPFCHSFDLTGGEDIDLFYRMIDNGANVVASAQAQTVSYRPASRSNLFWVMRRALRDGGTTVQILSLPCNWRRRMLLSCNAGFKGAKSAVRAGQHWRRDRTTAMDHLLWACQQFGGLLRLLGIRIEEFRHHH
jgi:glycosyltransferase involved in cell wall biosynthesis